jgi:hypothetical protein
MSAFFRRRIWGSCGGSRAGLRWTATVLWIAGAVPVSAQGARPAAGSLFEDTATRMIDLVDNGRFRSENPDQLDSNGVRPIPWWRSAHGMAQIHLAPAPDIQVLTTGAGEWAEQPIAAYAPLAGSLAIRGRVSGRGRVTWIDGVAGPASAVTFDVGADGSEEREFAISGREIAAKLGREPMPRFLLRLGPAAADGSATWHEIACTVELPCPSESELRARILTLLRQTLEPWLTRALDDEGPRKTAFLCHEIDALTGERLSTVAGGFNPLYEQLNDALAVAEVPEWRAAMERYIEDYLELGLARTTGLPCGWDPVKDEPILDRPTEIGLPWSFLIDLAERGPEKFRARAKAAAVKIGETVLAHGLLPDGNVGASYFPGDARVNPNIVQLRRFDVLAQLARLSALTGDKRYVDAADEAFAAFEFTHYWAGTWEAIDPAFDDDYGHYGARAATIALACPTDKLFRRFAIDGFKHFQPLWHDALRLGGNVAADQVRCWNIADDIARLEPALKPGIQAILPLAARSHFKGEQYGDGAWGDVTIFDFDPKSVETGDYPGAPQNLLNGLATIYGGDLSLPREDLRALYAAVLASSVEHYLRPHGFLFERSERRGRNSASGTLRMMLGLVKMLSKL